MLSINCVFRLAIDQNKFAQIVPNQSPLSITHLGNAGYSPNIYYDIETIEIHIVDKTFHLIEVTPRYIVITDNIEETNKEYV